MLKFKRNYQAEFIIKDKSTKREEVVIIEPPITVSFKTFASYLNDNGSTFQFINLDYDTQRKLWRDFYNYADKDITLRFFAGYGKTEDLPLICNMTVYRCTSYREGVDMYTDLQCTLSPQSFESVGFANITFDKGSKYSDIVSSLIDRIPDLKVGFIADDLGELPNSRTFIGNSIELISNEFKNHHVYIENNELNIVKQDTYVPSEITMISEESGMLDTPRIQEAYLQINTVFEPNISLLQLIYLNSQYSLLQKQIYQVYDISHQGVISETQCSNLTTSLSVLLPKFNYKDKNNMAQKPLQQKEEQRDKKYSTTSYNWIKPVNGRISSNYGKRVAPVAGASTDHRGIDIEANAGTIVKAPANGTVVSASRDQWNGNIVRINHGNGIVSIYAHLQSYSVSSGQKVNQGDIIGYVGSTGISTGPHLHFGVKQNDVYVNPNKFVRY